ncbi:uncharacterized protein C6orf136 homolog [Stegastes partitus]|uniref:Uncharacterized protein C6orf136 homolog n=1 Tax=Stegastes partitus TaxID=144197 RepID=A0A3B4ZE83_9TELE|nr:PREDICTED: uncharacterized protein C6orf136 homolog [Stegastes partitus]XP_008279177.1 PREDICTED: uncharacterized protein C6orf136 homolog [Stegastes partitus]
MAVSRGGVAFWVGCVCSYGRRQPFQKLSWRLSKVVDWPWICQTHPLSSATWALAPPNSLRYQTIKQPVLSYPLHHSSQPQRQDDYEEDCGESISVYVLMRQGESKGLHTLLEIPLFGPNKPGELHKSSAFSFPLTVVDGSREDDISVNSFKRNGTTAADGEHGCFRSLFEAEGCPAPFMYGSRFYCFHCPGMHLTPGSALTYSQDGGLDRKLVEMPPVALCSQAGSAERKHAEGDREGEEKLAMMYERLRIELPNFFMTNHDYTMYSNDVEFINGLINVKIRGRLMYQVTLSLWRFLCLCYYVEARLDVLKVTKHMEDGTIKARWRIKGLPLHSLMLRFYRKDKSQLYRSYDAFSTFYIGQDGLIHCHKVEKVMPAQPPVLPRVTSFLTGALVALGVQEHRPALNLLPLLLSSLRQSSR